MKGAKHLTAILRFVSSLRAVFFAILAVIGTPITVFADTSFDSMNDVLYSTPCSADTSDTSDTSDSDGGGCGDQGYANGARASDANKKQIWDFLKSKGLSDYSAAGIMGNMAQESAFMPDAVNFLGCSGIVQWCFERNTSMREYAQKNGGKDWNCLGSQLEYMWYEVTETGEKGVMDDPSFKNATSASQAANAWANDFERMRSDELAGRSDRAEELYKEMTGKSDSGSSSSNSSDDSSDDDSCSSSSSSSTSSSSSSSSSSK